MIEPSDNQKKASLIISKHRIIEQITEMLDCSYNFTSSEKCSFESLYKYDEIYKIDNFSCEKLIKISSDEGVVMLGLGKFETSLAPDSNSWHAKAYVFYNSKLVLETRAMKVYPDCIYSRPELTIWGTAESIKSFIAGPWIELIGEMHKETRLAKIERDKIERHIAIKKREKEEESSFSFKDYDTDLK